MVLRLSLYSSQSPWWFSDYSYSHHSILGGTQTIPILITVPLVALRIFLYSSQSTYWFKQSLYSLQSPWWYSDYPFIHHSLSGGPQTISIPITVYLVAQLISILITVSLVVLRLSLYSSLSLWWYSDYPYTHHSLSGNTGIRPSLYSSQSPWWYSEYPYEHHSLPGGTQTIPTLNTVSLVVLRLSL